MIKSRECQGGGYNTQTQDFNPGNTGFIEVLIQFQHD